MIKTQIGTKFKLFKIRCDPKNYQIYMDLMSKIEKNQKKNTGNLFKTSDILSFSSVMETYLGQIEKIRGS